MDVRRTAGTLRQVPALTSPPGPAPGLSAPGLTAPDLITPYLIDSSVTETALRDQGRAERPYHCQVPSQILIRPAVPADYDAIARITRDAYLAAGYFESADHPYMRQIQNVEQRAADATVWVAEREGRILGSVTLAVEGEPYADIAQSDELEFRMLVVDPSVQRSGAGKAMVQAIIDHARSLPGIHAVALTTGESWESAHGLYRKTGFLRAPERDWLVPGTDIKLLVYRQEL